MELQPFPDPGTPAWDEMNDRRYRLGRRVIRKEATPEEQREYEYLQSESLAALQRKYPAPPLQPLPDKKELS